VILPIETSAPPPHDDEAEKALLGCLLLDPSQMSKVAPLLSAEDFYNHANRKVYLAALSLHFAGTPCEGLFIRRELEARGQLEDVGGASFLASLAIDGLTPTNAKHYATVVRECAAKRELLNAAYGLAEHAKNGQPAIETAAEAGRALQAVVDTFSTRVHQDLFVPLESTMSEIPWIVRGYLARGSVTVLVGLPKAGKSTFAYAMAAAYQRGDTSFCDLACPEKGQVLVLSEEDDSVLGETWRAVGLDAATLPSITRRRAFPRRPLSVDIDLALKAAAAHGNIGLIVVDTWRFWSNLPPKAENDAGAVSQAYQQFARLAAAGYAVLILHHSRKAGGEDGTAAAGSNALTGSADVILELRRFGRDTKGTSRTISAFGRHQRIPAEVVVDLHDGKFRSIGDADSARDRLREDRVGATLASAGKWMTCDEIATETGMKSVSVPSVLKNLYAGNRIQRVGKGVRSSPFLYAALNVPIHTAPSDPSDTTTT
jgi:hypothetical protein